jgi:dethiobiotin synthetase
MSPVPLPNRSVFVAGTDTGVGKTWVAVRMIRALAARGSRVSGMKPVAAGAEHRAEGWRNDDALALAAASNTAPPYELINPVCLPLATSPHLAARAAGSRIDVGRIVTAYRELTRYADVIVAEGAGGWLAPIDHSQGASPRTMQDVAVALRLPVVLVVGLRLGCINHALLTQNAIRASGLEFIGWIGNAIEPEFDASGDYRRALAELLAVPEITL